MPIIPGAFGFNYKRPSYLFAGQIYTWNWPQLLAAKYLLNLETGQGTHSPLSLPAEQCFRYWQRVQKIRVQINVTTVQTDSGFINPITHLAGIKYTNTQVSTLDTGKIQYGAGTIYDVFNHIYKIPGAAVSPRLMGANNADSSSSSNGYFGDNTAASLVYYNSVSGTTTTNSNITTQWEFPLFVSFGAKLTIPPYYPISTSTGIFPDTTKPGNFWMPLILDNNPSFGNQSMIVSYARSPYTAQYFAINNFTVNPAGARLYIDGAQVNLYDVFQASPPSLPGYTRTFASSGSIVVTTSEA